MLATLAVCSVLLVPNVGYLQPSPAPITQMGYEGKNVRLAVSYGQLRFVKLTAPGGTLGITLAAGGDRVDIQMTRTALSVERSGNSVRIPFGQAAVLPAALDDARRLLTGSEAIRHFRELVARSERSGATGVLPLQLLLSESVVSIAEGNVDAPQRLRARLQQRREAARRPALRLALVSMLQQRDCVSEYESALLNIDNQLSDCLESADNHAWFYERAAQRLLCHAEFIARAEGALFQFAACSAFPKIA